MMQIRALVLYSRTGEARTIPFQEGRLNIITGQSKTGKSSIIGILRFLLGSNSPHVPIGPIQRSVSWYGLAVQVGEASLFVGRPAPEHGTTTSAAFLRFGPGEIPEWEELEVNSNGDEIREVLGGLIGIEDNLNVPREGQTRRPLSATFVHSLTYCFQGQGEIANPDILFHRQNREWQPQTIRDTLPYFLGAQGVDALRKREELVRTRRDLRRATTQLERMRSIQEVGVDQLGILWREAVRVGIVPDVMPPSWEEATDALHLALETDLDTEPGQTGQLTPMDDLLDVRQELRRDLRRLNESLRGLDSFASVEEGYAAELNEHRVRLSSIGLLPTESSIDCPLCAQSLPAPEEKKSVLTQMLEEVSEKLSGTIRERPRVQRVREDLLERKRGIVAALRDADAAIQAIAAEEEAAGRAKQLWEAKSFVRGRLVQFLEESPDGAGQDIGELERNIGVLRELEARLADELDPDSLRSRVVSILNIVSRKMNEYARTLDLEHSNHGARIDGDRLTIVADTPDGPAYMDTGEIGSGMNWVGYHLTAHLALHHYFIEHNRPVPSFMIVDQPSQAFFPRDRESGGDMDELTDTDREQTRQLYELMHQATQELDGQFQIIAFDHADFPEAWFQDAIVERWRDGVALVPPSWDADTSS